MATYQFFAYAPEALPFDPNTGTFRLDPNYDPVTDRVSITIDDDDAFLDGDAGNDEVGDDTNQIGTVTNPQGDVIATGQIYGEAYATLQHPVTGSLVTIDRIEIGGLRVAYAPSAPLEPGVDYIFVGETNIDDGQSPTTDQPDDDDEDQQPDTRLQYSDYEARSLACFATGTRLRTPAGDVPVEWLRPGTELLTRDDGAMPIRWVGRVRAGGAPAIRLHGPQKPLTLSAQHRVLISGQLTDLLFAEGEVLAPAKALSGPAWGQPCRLPPRAAFYHVLLDRHALVMANGVWVESLFLGDRLDDLPGMSVPRSLRNELAPAHDKTVRPVLRCREAAMIPALSAPNPQEAGRAAPPGALRLGA